MEQFCPPLIKFQIPSSKFQEKSNIQSLKTPIRSLEYLELGILKLRVSAPSPPHAPASPSGSADNSPRTPDETPQTSRSLSPPEPPSSISKTCKSCARSTFGFQESPARYINAANTPA